jgi:hypothetical protein
MGAASVGQAEVAGTVKTDVAVAGGRLLRQARGHD